MSTPYVSEKTCEDGIRRSEAYNDMESDHEKRKEDELIHMIQTKNGLNPTLILGPITQEKR